MVAGDLDIVVQPGISYDAINATLKEQGIPLFFPVDPAPFVPSSFFSSPAPSDYHPRGSIVELKLAV